MTLVTWAFVALLGPNGHIADGFCLIALPILVLEGIIWVIYQAQYNASARDDSIEPDATTNTHPFPVVAPILKPIPTIQANPAVPVPCQAEQTLQRPLTKVLEDRLDYELRWRRDVRHGNPTQEDRDRQTLQQQEHQEQHSKQEQCHKDEERTLERQLEELENLIKSRPHPTQ